MKYSTNNLQRVQPCVFCPIACSRARIGDFASRTGRKAVNRFSFSQADEPRGSAAPAGADSDGKIRMANERLL